MGGEGVEGVEGGIVEDLDASPCVIRKSEGGWALEKVVWFVRIFCGCRERM